MLRTQHNARVHAVATFIACLLGLGFGISRLEWCTVLVAIVAVWTAEALNTALELLCDVASPDFHPLVEQAKDIAAGAVLISAIGSVLLAVLIFGPKLLLAVGR
jgi:diacylglycerol kinase (ATP)